MNTFSAAASRNITQKAQVLHLLAALLPDDTADDVLLACLSEAMDLATVSKFSEFMWVSTVSRLCGRDTDLLPPVRMEVAKCPDIPDFSTHLSQKQDAIGLRVFDACRQQNLTSVQASIGCLMLATLAAEACGLTRRGWKEYARKVWELWHVEAKSVGGRE